MKTLLVILALSLVPLTSARASLHQAQVLSEQIADRVQERFETHVQVVHSARNFSARKMLSDAEWQKFIDWIVREYGESARPIGDDFAILRQSWNTVMVGPCALQQSDYVFHCGNIGGIVGKYAAFAGCASRPETVFFADTCKFFGHVAGKYGFRGGAWLTHELACR